MERRFRVRLDELLDDAEVHPGLLRGMAPRLEGFLRPFVESLGSDARRRNATGYVRGLLSNLGAKTAEAIAYLHDRERQGLQKFIGQADWDHRPLLAELARQVGAELGEPDGVLVFDPSAFPKKGAASVGVQRQWCGRLGKLENCQVGVYLAYVSRREHALVDVRLYLPEEWTRTRKRMTGRRGAAGGAVPDPAPVGPGHARRAGRPAPARLGVGGRRAGPVVVAPPAVAGAGGGVPAGRPVEHVGPGPGRRGAVRGLRAIPEGPVHPGGPVGRRSAGGGVAGGRGAGRREGAAGGAGGPRAWCRRWPSAGRRTRRSWRWRSGSGSRTGRGSTTTCCRTPRRTPRWPSSPGCSRPGTGSRSA